MGAWGAGGFENDAALDFAASVARVEDIAAAFAIVPGETVDADSASRVIAAAECVAAMLARPADDLPETLRTRLSRLGKPSADLLETARGQLSQVISSSELTELWAAADEPAAFNLAMTGLIERLNPEIRPKGKNRKKKAPVNLSPCAFCNKPMGGDMHGRFEISVDTGGEAPMRLGKSAHLDCLNARLHPAHIVQAWKFDPDAIAAEAERLLRDEDD